MSLQIKRVYEPAARSDGMRVLIDRLWPRGLSKEKAKVDLWLKEIAPSDTLRKSFGHDPAKWESFRRSYKAELKKSPAREALAQLNALVRKRAVTLLFAAKDEVHCNAAVLKEVISK